jgi:hypothetical protein
MTDTMKSQPPESTTHPTTNENPEQTEGLQVPESERGKAENMSFYRKSPSAVFALVGLTYWLALIVVLLIISFVWWIWGS